MVRLLRLATASLFALASLASPSLVASVRAQAAPAAAAGRPMTWLDVQNMRQVGSPAPSPDGKWLLYTLSTPDWKESRRQNDVYVVNTAQGIASTRRLTFTNDKNESAPSWSRDGKFFVFLSDRDAARDAAANRGSSLPISGPGAPYFPPAVGGGMGGPTYQLYLMRPDGGEARRITDAKDGVTTYAFSKDGSSLVYRSGPVTQEQLYALPVAALRRGARAERPGARRLSRTTEEARSRARPRR